MNTRRTSFLTTNIFVSAEVSYTVLMNSHIRICRNIWRNNLTSGFLIVWHPFTRKTESSSLSWRHTSSEITSRILLTRVDGLISQSFIFCTWNEFCSRKKGTWFCDKVHLLFTMGPVRAKGIWAFLKTTI